MKIDLQQYMMMTFHSLMEQKGNISDLSGTYHMVSLLLLAIKKSKYCLLSNTTIESQDGSGQCLPVWVLKA
jgi:hypothetical protein